MNTHLHKETENCLKRCILKLLSLGTPKEAKVFVGPPLRKNNVVLLVSYHCCEKKMPQTYQFWRLKIQNGSY